ncbi:hypothetical protein ACH4MW_28220 [Streptomyces luteogriseus]|uniref:hypothetical protein n=1 Tax=Streptomyces luteogriseus TaxID=68233 RepID=UPI00379C0FDF
MSLRRVNFAGPNGGTVYIQSANHSGVVSRIADHIENERVDTARILLALVLPMLEADKMSADEATFMLGRTAESLAEVIAVAESRGERLNPPDEDEDDEDEASDGEASAG